MSEQRVSKEEGMEMNDATVLMMKAQQGRGIIFISMSIFNYLCRSAMQ